jgi:hypothetical protein
MADPHKSKLFIAVIAVGFAVTIALAQNSTPEPEIPVTQVTPILKPLEQDSPPNLESLSTEPNNPAMQTLRGLALARSHSDMNCTVAWPSHESPARNSAGLYDYSVVR